MILVTGVLLAVCVSLALSARSLIADQTLRTYWCSWAFGAGAVSVAVIGVLFMSADSISTALLASLLLVSTFLLAVQSIIVNKSLRYIKSIHNVNGISIIDPLTGVYNRFYLEQRLDMEIARSHRYNTPLALVVAEIADFNYFKDEYGHQVGEIALQRLAEKLVSLLRETDVVVRFVDGQFVLLLPDTPEGSTQALVDRIDKAVSGLLVVAGAGVERSIRINVDFGLAHCVIDTRNSAELIDMAFKSVKTRSKRRELADIGQTIGVV